MQYANHGDTARAIKESTGSTMTDLNAQPAGLLYRPLFQLRIIALIILIFPDHCISSSKIGIDC
jgi:hypothetical protein